MIFKKRAFGFFNVVMQHIMEQQDMKNKKNSKSRKKRKQNNEEEEDEGEFRGALRCQVGTKPCWPSRHFTAYRSRTIVARRII